MQGDDAGQQSGRVLAAAGVVKAGEHQRLVPVAGEGVGAGAGDGPQPVEVGTNGLAAAASFSGLQQPDRQAFQGGAGLGLVVAGHLHPALAQPDDSSIQVTNATSAPRGLSSSGRPVVTQNRLHTRQDLA